MSKVEFLAQLRKGLSGLPQDDIEERLTFYSEMIDDQMEEGLSEEEAVSSVGKVDEIIAQVVSETPFTKIAKERIKPKRRLSTGEIILLVLGSPLWLSLVIAAFAVIFSLYISLWAVIISLWSVFLSFAVCCVGCVLLGGFLIISGGDFPKGIAMLAVGIVCAGFSIFAFFGCKVATNGILLFTKKMAMWIKNCIIKKEEA